MVKQDVKMLQSKVFVKYSVTQVQFSGAASLMSDVVTVIILRWVLIQGWALLRIN